MPASLLSREAFLWSACVHILPRAASGEPRLESSIVAVYPYHVCGLPPVVLCCNWYGNRYQKGHSLACSLLDARDAGPATGLRAVWTVSLKARRLSRAQPSLVLARGTYPYLQ